MKGDLYFVRDNKQSVVSLERKKITEYKDLFINHYFSAKPRDVLMDLGETWNDNGFPKFLFLHLRSQQQVWVKPEDINCGRVERLIHERQITGEW